MVSRDMECMPVCVEMYVRVYVFVPVCMHRDVCIMCRGVYVGVLGMKVCVCVGMCVQMCDMLDMELRVIEAHLQPS